MGWQFANLRMLMDHYREWHARVFPSVPFGDFLAKVEDLGSKKALDAFMRERREELENAQEDAAAAKQAEGGAQDDAPPDDDDWRFDDDQGPSDDEDAMAMVPPAFDEDEMAMVPAAFEDEAGPTEAEVAAAAAKARAARLAKVAARKEAFQRRRRAEGCYAPGGCKGGACYAPRCPVRVALIGAAPSPAKRARTEAESAQ